MRISDSVDDSSRDTSVCLGWTIMAQRTLMRDLPGYLALVGNGC